MNRKKVHITHSTIYFLFYTREHKLHYENKHSGNRKDPQISNIKHKLADLLNIILWNAKDIYFNIKMG